MDAIDKCLDVLASIEGPTPEMFNDTELFILTLAQDPEFSTGRWAPHVIHYNTDDEQLELRWHDLRHHTLIISVTKHLRWGFVDDNHVYGNMSSIRLSSDDAQALLRTALRTYTRVLQ